MPIAYGKPQRVANYELRPTHGGAKGIIGGRLRFQQHLDGSAHVKQGRKWPKICRRNSRRRSSHCVKVKFCDLGVEVEIKHLRILA